MTDIINRIEKTIEPYQSVVTVALIAVIVLATWALFQRDPVKRTMAALFVWL